jgi:ribosome-associated protein
VLDVDGKFVIPEGEFTIDYVRSSGPGGQNVNKVSTKAIVKWSPATSTAVPGPVRTRFLARYGSRLTSTGDLIITSQRFRTQTGNLEDCFEKLREMLRSVLTAPKVRRPTKRTRGSQERRLSEKKRRSETKRGRRGVDD